MREFFGIDGYSRTPEGFLSWQHLLFVGLLLTAMVVLAIVLGIHNRDKSGEEKNKVLVWAAILIDAFEIFKIALFCYIDKSAEPILYNLPLFLCSIQLIALPLAAFTNGRIKEAAIDFVCIFGILGAVFGTIGAGQNYNAYPVLSFINVVSGITHSISGFASLYILISKMASLKKKNIYITFSILLGFCVSAYMANLIIGYNYMFLMNHDGTPYSIVYNLVNGSPILYPLIVVALFLVYIALFYALFFVFTNKKANKIPVSAEKQEKKEEVTV